jgi:hypothetical protein
MKEGRRIDELRLAAQRYRTLLDLWTATPFSAWLAQSMRNQAMMDVLTRLLLVNPIKL